MITKPLGEIADILISNVDKKSKDNEKEVKLCNFVDVYYNWAITANNEKDFMIATASDTAIGKFTLHKGDVAITKDSETRNDIGVATYISEELDNVLLGYHCILIHPNEEIVLGKYLNVVLHSSYAQKYFEANASGSGQRYTLTDTIVKEMPIPLPNINIQRKIGDIPSYIDRKIENNNKINAELESMAKTIYDYWFLQFEFPNEEGKPYKSSGGKMVWNEELKREIPEGWGVKVIEDFCRIFTGKKDVNQALEAGEYKFFSCSPDYKYSNEMLHSGKAILVSGNGSYTGRTIFVNDAFDLYQRTYACVSSTDKDILEYIYYSMLRVFTQKVGGGTHGSAIPYIVFDDIAKEPILYNADIVEKYQNIVIPLQEKIIENQRENEELSSLRDFLLPMLMNGQVEFK